VPMTPPPPRAVGRRKLLASAATLGAASLGRQFFTAPAAGAAEAGTLIVVFLRGGMDGLAVLVPADDPHVADARPRIGVPAGALLPLDRGFGLNPALKPIHPLWQKGQLTAIPAVSTPDLSRSHFQAQDCLERGAADFSVSEGWLDRVLDKMAPAGAFRAVGQGTALPRALLGDQPSLGLHKLDKFNLVGDDAQLRADSMGALQALYTGLEHPLSVDVATTLKAVDEVTLAAATEYQPAAAYPAGEFAAGLQQMARLIKLGTGLRVGCIDLDGWDTHSYVGTVDGGRMKDQLTILAAGLAAFAADLGDGFDKVTVVTVTEFGRRLVQNAAGGTDHGHGAVVLALGGGLNGGKVHGNWQGLAPDVLDNGDVPGLNDYRNVLGDMVVGRLGLSPADVAAVFPGHRYQSLGIMR
jgi:uncharacterized protein (DUF1501 family)